MVLTNDGQKCNVACVTLRPGSTRRGDVALMRRPVVFQQRVTLPGGA